MKRPDAMSDSHDPQSTKAARIKLTTDRIRRFTCPPDKSQAFLRDLIAPGLGIRATAGSKSYIFQSKLKDGRTVRITIGDWHTLDIDQAREAARQLQVIVDQGKDPRQEKRKQTAEAVAQLERERLTQAPALEAWAHYIHARRHHWGEAHIACHEDAAKPGGEPRPRGRKGLTQPGILRPLLEQPLSQLRAPTIEAWLKEEAAVRPTRARLAYSILRAFLNWCAETAEYRDQADPTACTTKAVQQELPKKKARKDALLREQLEAWFREVRRLHSPVVAAYLQGILLTGARPGELCILKWEDVDFQWNSLTVRDKVEGDRTIPLTPYFAALLRDLKARNETPPRRPARLKKGQQEEAAAAAPWQPSPWVFSSSQSATGWLQDPSNQHKQACRRAGIDPLTLHGLRRSFGSLAEWTETPAGVVAQIMGHKPSATAEKHYRVRPLDLLRMWHSKIEAWMLEQARLDQSAGSQAPAPRAVA